MKIKTKDVLLLSLLYWAGTAGVQANDGVEKPQDFAYGMPLTTEGNEPFFSINLPEEVYAESVWSDMRDVRVFNNQGQTVPFALTANVAVQNDRQTFPLRLFPMSDKKTTEQEVISLRSPGGVEVTLPVDATRQIGRTYLLEIPESSEGRYPRLTQLKLAWESLPENWQTHVSVLYSRDLKEWSDGVDNVPLMELVSGGDRLRLDTVDLDIYAGDSRTRYLLLVFKDTVPDLKIDSVQGISASSYTEYQRITLKPVANAISANEAEYSWSRPQPLNSISVRPSQNNTVLPLEIDYRSAADDGWHPLTKQVAYSVNGRTMEEISLNGLLVQGIRLKGIHQQWGDQLPEVSAERDRKSLVFNAAGSGPFLLAWGNKVAQPQAIALDTLIPADLRKTVAADALPLAEFQERVELGGAERLSAVDAAEEASMWRRALLWVALVLGAGALVLLALKLWKEIQQKPE